MGENYYQGYGFDDDPSELELVVEYLTGNASAGVCEELEARMRTDPALRDRFEQTRLLWKRFGVAYDIAISDVTVEALRSRIMNAINAAPPDAP